MQPDSNRIPEIILPVPSDIFEQETMDPSDIRMHMEEIVTDEYYQEVTLQKMYVNVTPVETNRANPIDVVKKRGNFDSYIDNAKQKPSIPNPRNNKYKAEPSAISLQKWHG